MTPSRLIVHVDMNSYFASVEQQANPFLRGKAVGVCAYLHPYGCVIAASVEAKQLGMKVGMSVKEAKERVPSAVFVQNDPSKYRAVTTKLFSLLHDLSDTVEHYSIDEAFVDLTGWCRDEAEAAFLTSRVKHRIRTEIGEWLRCSVGIAPTRFLAKFASDQVKPDGLVIINRENLQSHLLRADLEDAHGIGPRFRKRLEALGIFTLLDLQRYPVENLMRVFGKQGFYFWCCVNGVEHESVFNGVTAPKSIGHSYCVPNRVNKTGTVEPVLVKLVERAGRRLRGYGLLTHAMTVCVGIRPHADYRVASARFPEPEQDSFVLSDHVRRLLRELRPRNESVDFLSVTLMDLCEPSNQLSFGVYGQDVSQRFDQMDRSGREFACPDLRRRAVSASMDRVRDRYGERSIVLGRMFEMLSSDDAPDRIGFRKTVEQVNVTFRELEHESFDS